MSRRLYHFLAVLFLILTVVVIYGQTADHGAVNCDDYYFTEYPYFGQVFSAEGLRYVWQHTVCKVWMPITGLMVGLESEIFGRNYGAWHLFGALLHCCNAILIFWALSKMTRAPAKSFLVAAIFALHPLSVESVAWLVSIRIVIPALFALFALYCYVAYVQYNLFKWYLFSLLAYGLSLLAFPQFICLPFVFVLLDIWPLSRLQQGSSPGSVGLKPLLRSCWEKYPFFLAMLVIGLTVIHTHALPQVYHYPLADRLLNAILSYGRYVKKLFWPLDLAAYYPYPADFDLWRIVLVAGLLAGVTALAWIWRRQWPYVLIGWLWFAGMIFPFIGIAQVGTQAMADHYTYLALVGAAVAVVWGAADLLDRLKTPGYGKILLAGTALVLLGILSHRQTAHWQNSVTLARRMLSVTEDNAEAYNYLGQAQAAHQKLDKAVAAFQKGLLIQPDHINLNYNLALALTRQNRLDRAIQHYEAVVAKDPGNLQAHNNLGALYESRQKRLKAEFHYRRALAADPTYTTARLNLAGLYQKTGQLARAIEQYETIVQNTGGHPEAHYQLALIFSEQGRPSKALAQIEKALALQPDRLAFQQVRQQLLREGGDASDPD